MMMTTTTKKTYKSTGRYHNYGHLIKFFCSKSEKYIPSLEEKKETVDLSDKNSESRIKHYIDGTEFLTIKYLFLTSFEVGREVTVDPPSSLLEGKKKFFLKPSHAFIGGGKGIYYLQSSYKDFVEKAPLLDKKKYNYFFDEEVKNTVVTASPSSNKKWDCRSFAILYINNKKELKLFLAVRAFARIESGVKPGLTNLSFIDKNKDYDIENYMEEIHPSTVKAINKEFGALFFRHFVEKLSITTSASKEEEFSSQFVILGIDSILSTLDKPNVKINPSDPFTFPFKVNFIEVNDSPVMIASKKNIEGNITYDIFENLIEKILFDEKPDEECLFEYPVKYTVKKETPLFTPSLRRKYFTFLEDEKKTHEKRNKEINYDEYI